MWKWFLLKGDLFQVYPRLKWINTKLYFRLIHLCKNKNILKYNSVLYKSKGDYNRKFYQNYNPINVVVIYTINKTFTYTLLVILFNNLLISGYNFIIGNSLGDFR